MADESEAGVSHVAMSAPAEGSLHHCFMPDSELLTLAGPVVATQLACSGSVRAIFSRIVETLIRTYSFELDPQNLLCHILQIRSRYWMGMVAHGINLHRHISSIALG